jgi:hypothetical protein
MYGSVMEKSVGVRPLEKTEGPLKCILKEEGGNSKIVKIYTNLFCA